MIGPWKEEMLLEILEDGVIVKPRVSFLKYGEKDGEVGSIWR